MALAPPGRSHAGRPTFPRNYLLTLLPSLHHRRKSGATGGESMVADPGLIHPRARHTTGFSATLVLGKTRHGRLLAAASSACQGAEGSCRSSHAEQSPPSAPLYPRSQLLRRSTELFAPSEVGPRVRIPLAPPASRVRT